MIKQDIIISNWSTVHPIDHVSKNTRRGRWRKELKRKYDWREKRFGRVEMESVIVEHIEFGGMWVRVHFFLNWVNSIEKTRLFLDMSELKSKYEENYNFNYNILYIYNLFQLKSNPNWTIEPVKKCRMYFIIYTFVIDVFLIIYTYNI